MIENPIQANYEQILERIARAAQSVGRSPQAVKLVVVTKGHPLSAIWAALAAGIHIFGENYPEEGVEKALACAAQPGLEWHMIGHVQSRKARLVCEHYHTLHALDSLKLAVRLDRFSLEVGRRLPVLLECNVSGEASKFGWPAWDESRWADLQADLSQIIALPNLQVRGLMTMAPFLPEAEQARPYFQRLRRLQDFLAGHLPQASWQELSMGMSADFEVAVQEGASMVRVGTAIMGQRSPEPV
jgi:pyridoxal phosphate enzyme (YggS family)